MIRFVDTHAHIHFPNYKLDREEVWESSRKAGVDRMILAGCRLEDSRGAVEFARVHEGVWAAVGVHPHEAEKFLAAENSKTDLENLLENPERDKIVAVGECGLDYFYTHSSKQKQVELLEFQLGLAKKYDLPVIFHIRDAFDDFWPVFDKFSVKRGVIHSFTGVKSDVGQILRRGLYIGLNGIMTFTKEKEQLEAARNIPLKSLVLETDAPYLTPKPFRGKVCKPEHVKLTAKFLADLREESLEQLALQTTENARRLFNLK